VPLEDAASPGGLARVRGVGVVDVVERGGPAARELIGDIAERLAIAIVNAHALIDLEQVLLAGGLTGIGPPLLVAVRAAFGKLCPSELRHGLAIDYGALGIWAGAMGAAVPWLPKDQAR
jgi:predicted NBD/HSP70 family sugar kinase